MAKKSQRSPKEVADAVHLLQQITEAYAVLQAGVKELREKSLIPRKTWTNLIVPADNSFYSMLRNLWNELERDTPLELSIEYLPEDQIASKYGVSRKTLYRRRKSKELAYIKDRRGEVWYSMKDLENYLSKNRITPLSEKPRKI